MKSALSWNVEEVSRRAVYPMRTENERPVSGHNGEWLGVLAAAWGSFLRVGKKDLAHECEYLIQNELQRECESFLHVLSSPSDVATNTMMLKLAAILTHNVGDIDQGLSYWPVDHTGKLDLQLRKYRRLAHERFHRFSGVFGQAKYLYKELLAAEGHRNYPLRTAKCLRLGLEFQLPLSPWLEEWGGILVSSPLIGDDNRAEVLRQLLHGIAAIPNQVGYYRAVVGMKLKGEGGGTFELAREVKRLDEKCLKMYELPTMKAHLSLSEEDFATHLGDRARTLLNSYKPPS